MEEVLSNILTLKQGITKYGPAPHKPILLLAVIDMFETGDIADNWIEPSEELVTRFLDVWSQLVKTPHQPTFALPFFHLKNEPNQLWNLLTMPGKTIPVTNSNSIKSYGALVNTVMAAKLSSDLYRAIADPLKRIHLKQNLLDRYFPTAKFNQNSEAYSSEVKKEILYDPSENYARKIQRKLSELPKELQEQEVIVRSNTFRKAVLEIYENRCAISGMKVEFNHKASLIDACHIQPFADSFDDTIRNGIALSPNLHRAFDRGMIAISDDYTVLLHKQVKDLSSNYSIKQFDNTPLFLPQDAIYHPDLQRLKEHRLKFGF